jgi:hypothetical protein
MAELANRMDHEADLARRLARLSTRHRKELIELLGNPPNPLNVPEGFWKKVENEERAEMTAALVLLFMYAGEQHNELLLPSDLRATATETMRDRAGEWADERASTFAAEYTANSRKRLDRAYERWARRGRPDIFPRTIFPPEVLNLPPDVMADDILSIFGPERDAGIAATETTGAATAGTNDAVGGAESAGLIVTVTWYTEADARVCPICKPLHGQRMKDWEGAMIAADLPTAAMDAVRGNGGPPAHPNCRCFLQTKAVPR